MTKAHQIGILKNKKIQVLLYAGFVLLTSFFTYMYRYDFPASPFWDEPYHIASGQKYLNKVYFMEQHPPLGKLLIALGEKMIHPNEKNDQYITTDYATNIPQGFSFAGYRFFPALFGWLTAVVLFFIFLAITANAPASALLSFLYIFDNAQIVHSRGAMIDSTLSFFGMMCVLLFLHLQRKDAKKSIFVFCVLSGLFGAFFGFTLATKVVGLIFILLVPALCVLLFPQWKRIASFLLCAFVGFAISYLSVWQVHFSLGQKIVPELADQGFYQASAAYKEILLGKDVGAVTSYVVKLKDSLRFVAHYNNGVPRLDLCKADENGSPSYFWPFGARTINYRWEQVSEGVYRYLYLQSNPVGWGFGLLGVVLAVILLLGPVFYTVKEKLRQPMLLLTFLALYISYMIAISQISRVMYLYHYFLPLLFSYILFGLCFHHLQKIGKFVLTNERKIILLTILGFCIFISYQWYRPLSYYEPISDEAFQYRSSVFGFWGLTCVRCEKKNAIVVPFSK